MDSEWLLLPEAIEAACEAKGFTRSTAVPRVISLARDLEVRSRMALEVNRHEGQPKPNVEMHEGHWRELEQFDSDWIDTGNAEWRDGYAWRGIQIHAGDLAIAMGTKGMHSHANLQLVAKRTSMVGQSEQQHFRCGQTFKRDDPAALAPWWTVIQSLAWIATRIPSYVEYIGNLETDEPHEHRPYIVHALCEAQVAESDEGQTFMEARRADWPAGSFLAHAGRALLEKILSGEVRPLTRECGQGRQMGAEDFVGIGTRETGADWLRLDPQPVFSSDEVLKAFPMEAALPSIDTSAVTPAELPAWLNPYQLVAWVQYRDLHVVSKAAGWNGLAAQHMYGTEPQIGTVLEVEGALQEGRLIAQGYPKNGDAFAPIPAVEWSRIALAPLEQSRQHPYVRIQFSRRDVLALFPKVGSEKNEGEPSLSAPAPARKKPGPKPDPDWPDAITNVTAHCIEAGFTKPLKRGELAAIQNLLLSAMAEKDKHPSDDTARKYAAQVIAKLPDNSG